ncbi:MAG TPA: response regulator [Methylobacterium sp.]|jgi:two-component system chemotaxis sensor kinase CheA|uniref:hybrid sensor histidine kinase/response regulator n=1 Tax=Methylorubrum sp. B1-46 TaxID=2897334 RepID=UPI001E65C862|nr:response regulator [Methylorubrum sp. B1-46]UGB24109.1 response regulator [Methylorubrum sp. B1-46]HEV2541681.1 response regulator [Methylobacterium sp.]
MDIRQQLLAAFEIEHREHLDAIRTALAAEGPVDWHDVFRRAHSLKGAARAVDLPPVEAVSHQLETLFERISAGQRPLDREARAATHLALDRIEAFVAASASGAASMPEDALAALNACLDPGAPAVSATAQAPPSAAVPPTPAIPPAPASEPSSEPAQSVLRIPASAVESLSRASHGLWAALPAQGSVGERIARLSANANALRRRTEAVRRVSVSPPAAAEASEMAALRQGLAEVETGLAALAREAADLAQGHKAAVLSVETAARRLREETERLALVPAETVFGGLARAVRDLARADGQEVDVTTRGLDVPVDRAMLQALKDPVLHALRNALSHGAESPEIRQRRGKPAALAIMLTVEAQGGRLVLGIHDDGRGPDLAAIEATGRERGLIAPGENLEAEALLALPFEPGFSTAGAVDALSGRGMGLSVVAEVARTLHGQVQLARRQPHGTSLILTLPLSAARRPVVIVTAGGSRFALPSGSAEALTRLDPSALSTVAGRPVAQVAGEGGEDVTLPVAELGDLLGLGVGRAEGGTIPVVRLRGTRGRCLLAVDRLEEVRTLLVLPPPPIGSDPALVTGTVILGTDTPALVLDPDGLIDRIGRAGPRAMRHPTKGAEDGSGTISEKRRSTILVVDDSITTRTLEKSILEAAGYRVIVCVDGQEALDRLRARIEPVDLVVADVEMPRLTGFGLVEALRAEEDFARLPIVLMTSRGDEEDVARGLELGADAYLTKQKFDQRELLDTIGQLL